MRRDREQIKYWSLRPASWRAVFEVIKVNFTGTASMENACRIVFMICLIHLLGGGLYAQRDLKVIPPTDPELERKTFILPEGFEVNLFAADPQIAKPIQMNFDPQGRLWIASSETYPHIEPGAKPKDKILYLQDLDGDGVSDKTEVFAEGLLIPTAVAYGNDGVYVGASTELLHFKDTNGDGKADQKEIVLSGFGTEDTHHIIHTLRYGPDSHLYFNQSIYIHSHIETPWGIHRLNAGGMWRFRPETLELSVFARGLVNQWGTDFDRYGQTFGTDGAGGEGINYMVPGASYMTAYGAQRILHGLNPGSPKHCGLEIVESEHLPDDWQGSMITNDFRGHRVCRFVLTEDASGYRSQEQQEVIKSDHVAFRPIDVKQGPDGAIYIADWYNPIIQHGEVDFRDPRRDHTHGRIWRVTYTGKPTLKPVDFTKLSTDELLSHVDSPNRYSRSQAKVVLKEQGEKVLPEVLAWANKHSNDQLNLEALWIHQSFGKIEPALLGKCLNSKDHHVRAAATRVVGQLIQKVDSPLEILAQRIADTHPQVRLEAIRALAEVKQPEAVSIALQALEQDVDENIDYALWLTCRDLEPIWTPALLDGSLNVESPPQALPFLLRSSGSAAGTATLVQKIQQGTLDGSARLDALRVIADIGTPEHLGAIFDLSLSDNISDEFRHALLHTLYPAAVNRKIIPPRDLNQIKKLADANSPSIRAAVVMCIGAWKHQPLRDVVLSATQDEKISLQDRSSAIRALGAFSDQPAATELINLAKSKSAPILRRVAIEELLRLRPQQAANLSILFFQSASAPDSQPLFQSILQRKGAADHVAKALAGKTIPKDVAVVGARILSSSGQQDSALAKLLQTAGGLNQDPVKLSPAQMQTLVEDVLANGNAARGEQIFRRQNLNCLKCHAVGPAGGTIGSNLLSLGATAQPDYIIESILDPNAKVKEGFHTVVVATDEGKIYSGIKARETGTQLFLKDADGKELMILKDSIEQQKQGASLMPAGLTSNITHQELIDLSAFLYALGRVPEFTISTQQIVRHWETIQATQQAAFQFRRISYAAAATDNPDFQWSRVYSHVNGELAVSELPELRIRNRSAAGNRGMSFVRTEFNSESGKIGFKLNSGNGLQIWIDEKPIDSSELITAEVEKGQHQLTIAIDQSVRKTALKVMPVNDPGFAHIELPTGE
ncbi:PVC-type heme-binding CxxCH protein [Thalassoglobus polymorphus]|uniref:HEAT repeat protein n=1 Tax=Thalassoglobus polymorphus TaxID=2527994 RepID=A0A517QV48_9PLAN|nr:PVC-type heme-binding CxxCH protein [Thalassoglobus polymorphus]QDT35516.1 HEAT repeat protein [Thalassoglobus polymorphus]